MVIRDSNGIMLAARCITKMGCLNLAVVEALAVLVSFQLCRESGIRRVQFEGDAKGVIDVVLLDEVDRGWMGHVIADTKQELQEFEDKLITFVKRDGNRVAAYILAKSAAKVVLNNTSHITPPDCISDSLVLEQLALVD